MGNDSGACTDAACPSAICVLYEYTADASLTKIGLAAPVATIFGIVLNVVFYIWCNRKDKAKHNNQ